MSRKIWADMAVVMLVVLNTVSVMLSVVLCIYSMQWVLAIVASLGLLLPGLIYIGRAEVLNE